MSPTILARLRAETRPAHDALEQLPFNQALTAGTISAETTAHFLEKMYGFLLPYEEALRQQELPAAWEVAQRCRAHLIADDLSAAAAARLPRCPAMPPLATRAQLLGAMYVLEGSTLGGQVIARQLAQNGIALRTYFSGHAERTGPLWKSFTALLTEAATTNLQDDIVRSAGLTFQQLHAWLTQP